jgi:acyl-CoA thioesterase-1
LSRRAQCSFQVQVAVTSRLRGTKFLAFGDSITEGEVAPPFAGSTFRVVDTVNSYPTVLRGLLADRYPLQASEFNVINAGESGKTVVSDEDRLVQELSRHAPEALILLHGTNDVNGGTFPGSIGSSLRSNIRRAQQRGVKLVLLSTLLPQVPGRVRAYNPQGIIEANFVIRDIAAREGAVLVDTFAALDPMKGRLIGDDGLHPTVEGYRIVAETFLTAIRANFQIAGASSTPSFFSRPARR